MKGMQRSAARTKPTRRTELGSLGDGEIGRNRASDGVAALHGDLRALIARDLVLPLGREANGESIRRSQSAAGPQSNLGFWKCGAQNRGKECHLVDARR
jgi:hypothetical protein